MSKRIAERISAAGFDAIEISAGIGTTSSQVLVESDPERAYFRKRASAVKRAVTVPVMVVGGIRSLEMARNIVDSGDADLISMSRPFIREPGLIARWQRGETEPEPANCISCNQCFGTVRKGEPLECMQEHLSTRD